MKCDYLIVGAGFSGCVLAERISSQLDKRVLIVEKRDHIGGNCYDYYNSDGILVHKYGPHWFHTNDAGVFAYISRFTQWRHHFHKVKACVDGMKLPFPINMDTINGLYGMKLTSPEEVQQFYDSVRVKEIVNPANAEEMIISQVGWDLYNKFYKHYTKKQWQLDPKELKGSITARVPVRTSRDDRYFTDTYQGLPKHGYNELFRKMTTHSKISILLQVDYKEVLDSIAFDQMIYTGPIDSFFDHTFGRLPYRSLRFEHETLDVENYQDCQQVNYPKDFDFTRVLEWKHATGQRHHKTTITREYPCSPDEINDKFYPVLTGESEQLLRKYQEEAARLKNVKFCGRLADFKYYNMDQVIARALSVFEKDICGSFAKLNINYGKDRKGTSSPEPFGRGQLSF
jgi:UDP-galactopyranose mutase